MLPPSGGLGEVAYDINLQKFFVYNGENWIELIINEPLTGLECRVTPNEVNDSLSNLREQFEQYSNETEIENLE